MDRHGSTPTELAERLAAECRGAAFLAYRDGEGVHRLLELDPRRASTSPGHSRSRPTATSAELPAVAKISDAQRRVLVALCRPYASGEAFALPATNQQIADELFLSVDAVKSHLRALFEKFGIG